MAKPTFLGAQTLIQGVNNLTVPTGTQAALLMGTWWGYDSAAVPAITASWADFNLSPNLVTVGAVWSASPYNSGAIRSKAAVTATGAQTLTFSNPSAAEGPAGTVVYLGDVDFATMTLDEQWARPGEGSTLPTRSVSLVTNADTTIFAWDAAAGTTTVPANPSGWTSRATVTNNNFAGRTRSKDAATNPETVSANSTGYPAVIAFAIQGVTGGGPTNYTLTCDVGSYSLTGIAALLRRGFSLVADVGSYALTGQDAALRRGYTLVADTGTYALTGQDAALRRGYSLVCDVGAYSLTGNDATLTYSAGGTAYALTCDTGAYSLTGYDATLVFTPGAANYSLACDTGVYALTGNAAVMSLGRRLVLDVGSYSVTGQAANLVYGRRLVCETGVYALAGGDADLIYTTTGPIAYSLTCETGAYVLLGNDAALTYSAAQSDNLTHAAKGLIPKIWPGLSIRYEGKPKQRVEHLDEEERERIEEIAEQAVIEAANERTKKAMKASLQASMRAAEIELAAKSYLHLVEQAAMLRMEQIEEEDIAVTLLLM